jgi:hypothetical protein
MCTREPSATACEGREWSRLCRRLTRFHLDQWMKTLPQPWTAAMEATVFTGWIYDHLLAGGGDARGISRISPMPNAWSSDWWPGKDSELCTRCRAAFVADSDAEKVPIDARSRATAEPIGVSSCLSANFSVPGPQLVAYPGYFYPTSHPPLGTALPAQIPRRSTSDSIPSSSLRKFQLSGRPSEPAAFSREKAGLQRDAIRSQ